MQRSGATVADILDRLVGFDTTSYKTNIPLILYVEDYLRGQGVASYLVPTKDGQKASLFATIGPEDVAGVALSGHTDVVPVEGQAWDSDPFALTLRDGRYYGRGTTDMKGFLACVLAAVPRFKAAKLKKPVHIAFSYDEEVGCIGVRPMIAEMGTKLPLPRVVIVGEPTDMRVVDAHKGPVRWQVDIAGRAAHSSMAHLGVNAITAAGLIIGELARIEAELAARTPDVRFEPPYPTLQVTTIEGGTASNIVPVSCRFGFEIRSMPGLDIGAIETRLQTFIDTVCLPGMMARAPEAGITVTRKNYVPPFGTPEGSEAVALALALAGQNETFAVSYATEAGLFQDAGAASVVCGPGNIAQAHTANEWIAVSELEKCSQFMDKLADWCAA
ncbi:MAG: acetylornithine deacetylase [Hyphomicrobium sp.]|nr:acetylornithine deacetylase [Hyphomicrobium sp.]PPD07737.1 MAG: acetylornithine deacetylase [Hyphomicrobium sp.]